MGQSLPDTLDLHHPAEQTDSDPDATLNRVTDKSFPAVVEEEIVSSLRQGLGFDAVWKCEGATYKVHRLILAASSLYLKVLFNCRYWLQLLFLFI